MNLLMLGEDRVVKVLILMKGSVHSRSIPLSPLTSYWRTSPEVQRGDARLPDDPPLV